MKSFLILVLQIAVAIYGLLALAFLILEPQVEGRNAHATQFEIYFEDAFLAYVYLASTAFFLGLYQVEKLLSQIRRGSVASPEGIATLRNIKHCAGVVIATAVVSLLFMINGDPEDRPPGLALRLMVILPSIAVALLAAKFERRLHNVVDRGPGVGITH
jgi:hypothetical protein